MTIQAIRNIENVEHGEYGIILVDNNSESIEREKLIDFASSNNWQIINEGNCSVSNRKRILLLSKENYGYAKGNNLGLKLAKSIGYKWAVVMNNDVALEGPIIKQLVELLRSDPSIAVIGPKVLGKDGKRQGPSEKPGIKSYFVFPILYPILYPFSKIIKQMRKRNLDEAKIKYPYAILGCFMMLDLSVMEKIDWFDEGTFLYAEEYILSEKIFKAGYKIGYTELVSIKHMHKATTSQLGKKRISSIQLESIMYYFEKYRGYGKCRLFLIKIGYLYSFFVLDPVICWTKKVLKLFC